jgi:hypothetical protein
MRWQAPLTASVVARVAIAGALFVSAISPSAVAAEVAPIGAPEPAQKRHFGVFRSTPEGLPPGLPQTFPSEAPVAGQRGPCPIGGSGLNPALAQRVGPVGRGGLWVVPGSGCMVLLYDPDRHSGRGPTFATPRANRTAIRHGIVGSVSPRLVGFVPDNVIEVRLGEDLVAPVRDNTYSMPLGDRDPNSLFDYPILVRGAVQTR